MDPEKLMEISMKVIIAAGDGRDLIQKALLKVGNGETEQAYQLLDEAHEKLRIAHNAQTGVIQNEMSVDETRAATFLFSHAQDTLMTINSEYIITNGLIKLISGLLERIEILEGKNEEDK